MSKWIFNKEVSGSEFVEDDLVEEELGRLLVAKTVKCDLSVVSGHCSKDWHFCFVAVLEYVTYRLHNMFTYGDSNWKSSVCSEQVGQLSQTNRTATWSVFVENISGKSVHLTSLYGAKDISICWTI